jgi:sulfotransferase
MLRDRKFNFISGLPRSGSTLLSSILNQNPRFTCGISDPLFYYFDSKIYQTAYLKGMSTLVDEERLKGMIISDFREFYKNGSEVCFNTSRDWCSNTHILKGIFPDFKMIITIRSIPWILDSVERLHRKNPFTLKPIYDHLHLPSVYERTQHIMRNLGGNVEHERGFVSAPYESVKQAVSCNEQENILFVNYDALVKHPEEVINHVYEFLQEDVFKHNFGDVRASPDTQALYSKFDEDTMFRGLHDVRKEIGFEERASVLPFDLFNHYEQLNFWEHESNPLKNCNAIL